MFKHALFICSLLDLDLFEISHLYDERASMENEIKADKGGLLLPKRRKKQLEAQEAFVLALLREGDISAGRAAELLGVDRWQLGDPVDTRHLTV